MDLKLEKTATSYAVEVDVDGFLALTRHERSNWDEPHLCQQIESLQGVRNVQYDGHFGACIYFELDAENDVPGRHTEILKVIKDAFEALPSRTAEDDASSPAP